MLAKEELSVEVLHPNWRRDCLHCYYHPTSTSTDRQAQTVATSLEERGHKVTLVRASNERATSLDIQRRFGAGQGIVELKDTIPEGVEKFPPDTLFGFILNGHTEELHRLLAPEKGSFDRTVADIHEGLEEPCRSCAVLGWCGGGCRAAVLAEHRSRTGVTDVAAGHADCPVALRSFL